MTIDANCKYYTELAGVVDEETENYRNLTVMVAVD